MQRVESVTVIDTGVGQRPRVRRRRGSRLAYWFLGAFLAVVTGVLLWTASQVWWVARQDARPISDAIIVLGASQFDGIPSAVFEARLEHAQALYNDGVAPRLVTVGGRQQADRFTEAYAGKRWFLHHGVPASRVLAVEGGGDTAQSLHAVHSLLAKRGWHSVIVVTDPWHSLRARTIARNLGIDAEASPTRHGPIVRTRATQLRYIVRETFAYLYYWLFERS